MWNVGGVAAALTAAMLAAGGVALASDPAMPGMEHETNVEKQSGTEKKSPSSSLSLKGEDARKLQESLKEQGFYEGKIDGIIGPITEEALTKFQESKGFAATGKLDAQTASALGIEESDVQPVSGKETPEATPMTNSGSETTPDTGLDKSGTDDSVHTQSGDDKPMQDVETKTGDDADKGMSSDADPMDSDLGKDKEPVSGTEDEKDTTTSPTGGVVGQDDPNVVNDSDIEPQAGTSETFDKKTIKQVEQALKDKKFFKGKVDGVLDENTTNAIRRFQTDKGIVVTGQLDTATLDALGVKTGATNVPKNDVKTNTDGTNPDTGSTPVPDATPVGTPSEPISPPNGSDPIPNPNPGGMTPR